MSQKPALARNFAANRVQVSNQINEEASQQSQSQRQRQAQAEQDIKTDMQNAYASKLISNENDENRETPNKSNDNGFNFGANTVQEHQEQLLLKKKDTFKQIE